MLVWAGAVSLEVSLSEKAPVQPVAGAQYEVPGRTTLRRRK